MSTRGLCCLLSILISLIQPSHPQPLNISTLDSTIAAYAFRALSGRRSDVLYQVPLPSNLAGITASVIRVRSSRLWKKGVNSSNFHIPPRTVSVPHVKRLAVVYQDLGNWSSSYDNIRGFSIVSSVYGCLVYDSSNTSSTVVRDLGLRTVAHERIRVVFTGVEGMNSSRRCVRFGRDEVAHVGGLISSNVCYTGGTGHFAIVVPSAPEERGGRRWWVWVVVSVGGVVVLGLVGVGVLRMAKREKMSVNDAERGGALGTVVVGSSKMPYAVEKMRTQPALKDINGRD